MVAALGAYHQIVIQLAGVNDGTAAGTFLPQAAGKLESFAFFRRGLGALTRENHEHTFRVSAILFNATDQPGDLPLLL